MLMRHWYCNRPPHRVIPVLVRTSYVLGGQRMHRYQRRRTGTPRTQYIQTPAGQSRVLIDHFLERARR